MDSQMVPPSRRSSEVSLARLKAANRCTAEEMKQMREVRDIITILEKKNIFRVTMQRYDFWHDHSYRWTTT